MTEYRIVYEWSDGLHVFIDEDGWSREECMEYMMEVQKDTGHTCWIETREVTCSPWDKLDA